MLENIFSFIFMIFFIYLVIIKIIFRIKITNKIKKKISEDTLRCKKILKEDLKMNIYRILAKIFLLLTILFIIFINYIIFISKIEIVEFKKIMYQSFFIFFVLICITIIFSILYEKRYNQIIPQKIFDLYNIKLDYYPDKKIEFEDYEKSNFEKKLASNAFKSKHYIKKYINGFNFIINNIKTAKKYPYFSYERRELNLSFYTSFKGLYAISKIENNEDYILIIQHSLSEEDYPEEIKDKKITIDDKFITENEKFDNSYNIYTNNKEKTLNILNDTLINLLLKEDMIIKINYDIKIIKNNIYIRLNTKDIFDICYLNTTAQANNIYITVLYLKRLLILIEVFTTNYLNTEKFLNK